MYSRVESIALVGIKGVKVTVEVDISNGIPSFSIVGLPDEAVQESRERVRSAIKNAGFEFPLRRITVNLAPAEVRKEGSTFDLPIAIGILAVTDAIKNDETLKKFFFAGELSLDGSIRSITGALPMVMSLNKENANFILPYENRNETEIIETASVYPVKHIKEVVEFINGDREIVPEHRSLKSILDLETDFDEDLSDIKGQYQAKRALEIAAAGGHNLVMVGSPGSGKTLLARRIVSILPPLSEEEALEVTQIYSAAGLLKGGSIINTRPFRSPHHTASSASIIGGGNSPKPGEISLAHNGVLFLDELPEFRRDVLETLRQPMEDGFVTITRVKDRVTYPSRFMLIAAMNPCPCGWYKDPVHPCTCSISEIKKYRGKVSGPLWDRFDIQVDVPRLLPDELTKNVKSESSKEVRQIVRRARELQLARYKNTKAFNNASLSPRAIKEFIKLGREETSFINTASERFGLTGRGFDKVLKVARTIADIEGSVEVRLPHMAEALQYRTDLSVV
ncbi:MAG: YifB family Mg chelatase-like AAA ATPase [Caldisericaceae bacterium]